MYELVILTYRQMKPTSHGGDDWTDLTEHECEHDLLWHCCIVIHYWVSPVQDETNQPNFKTTAREVKHSDHLVTIFSWETLGPVLHVDVTDLLFLSNTAPGRIMFLITTRIPLGNELRKMTTRPGLWPGSQILQIPIQSSISDVTEQWTDQSPHLRGPKRRRCQVPAEPLAEDGSELVRSPEREQHNLRHLVIMLWLVGSWAENTNFTLIISLWSYF